MKTSTLILSLLLLNSSVLFAQFANWLFAYINPFVMIGTEIILVIVYFANTILRDVRNVFDIEVKL